MLQNYKTVFELFLFIEMIATHSYSNFGSGFGVLDPNVQDMDPKKLMRMYTYGYLLYDWLAGRMVAAMNGTSGSKAGGTHECSGTIKVKQGQGKAD